MRERQQLNINAVVTSGIWKFAEVVSEHELIELAKEWAAEDVDHRYIDLHVRKRAQSQYGIGFQYILKDESDCLDKKDYEEFFRTMHETLKKRFSNRFVGWDVSSSTNFII